MPDWQERITRESPPAIRAEHELRYRTAATLIGDAAVWTDLGCGNGLAAAAAIRDRKPPRAVLVDVVEDAVERAAGELDIEGTECIAADLTDTDDLARVGEALLRVDGERVVTCFEVVEHLRTFVPLLEWAAKLARDGAATFVLSVPNDAFLSVQNPHHLTSWGERAFEELQGLLPPERTLLRQVALGGSAVLAYDAGQADYELMTHVGGEGTVATHFLAGFGPRHRELWRGALALQTDALEQRRWERQRESNVAVAQKMVEDYKAALDEQERTVVEQRKQLRHNIAEFEDWRTYIHELETELGRPLAGSAEAPPPPDKANRRE
jgi:SAM-dependent methyltransferase